MNDPSPDDGIFDFAPEPPRAVVPITVPSVGPGTPKALNYLTPDMTPRAKVDPDLLKNLYIPLWLLAGGVVVDLISAVIWGGHPLRSTLVMLADLIFGTAFMLAGISIAAKVRHINLGEPRTAILKLAAICVAPSAVVAFITPITRFVPLGFLLAWGVQFILYFALLGALFDLDESDTWYCVWMILVVRITVYAAFLAIGHYV